jgi:hypothetical protein
VFGETALLELTVFDQPLPQGHAVIVIHRQQPHRRPTNRRETNQ